MKKTKWTVLLLMMTLCLFLPSAMAVEGWKVIGDQETGFNLINKHLPDVKIPLNTHNRDANVVKIRKPAEYRNIIFIEYFASEFGSNALIQVNNAVIYHTKLRRSLGEFPIKIASEGEKLEQPVWRLRENEIVITDPELSGETYTVKIPSM